MNYFENDNDCQEQSYTDQELDRISLALTYLIDVEDLDEA